MGQIEILQGERRAFEVSRYTSQISGSILAGLQYLSRHISASGKFDYTYNPLRNRVSSNYNLLRHAGTTMVLYLLVGSQFDDGSLEALASRAWVYLSSFVKAAEDLNSSCLVDDAGVAKLGGTALCVLALAGRIECSRNPEAHDIRLLTQLAQYLMSRQRKDGSFVCKEDFPAGEIIPFESLYYPGESILALCSAFRLTGDRSLLKKASHGARYLLERSLGDKPATNFTDHWLMISLAALNKLMPDAMWGEHLRRLAGPILAADRDSTFEGYETAQLATRLEALVATLEIEAQAVDHSRSGLLTGTILRGLEECGRRQIGPSHGLYADPLARGGFTRSATLMPIRIDYVQHALAASFGALRLLEPLASPPEEAARSSQVSVGMAWTRQKQKIFCDDLCYVHDGVVDTFPTYHLSHVLIAANGLLPWYPGGADSAARIAVYNAAILENILHRIYSYQLHGFGSADMIRTETKEYARWFVEEHFSPFPVSAADAWGQFSRRIDAEKIARLSPYFFCLKRDELSLQDIEIMGYEIFFESTDCPRATGAAAEFQMKVRDQLLQLEI